MQLSTDPNLAIKQELARRELARRSLLEYTKYTMPEFEPTPFHQVYYKVLDLFIRKQIKKLMITVPPQHGKSEGSSKRLPTMVHGLHPDTRIGVLSYSAGYARGFNRENQRIIESPEYRVLFPKTYLSKGTESKGNYLQNSNIYEIVGHKGFLKTVGRGGALTGSPLDLAIMDDLYKDAMEGNSPIIRRAVIDWYTSVVMKRLHNDSQQLIVFTRWHDEDLIGWLEKRDKVITLDSWDQLKNIDPNAWYKINFPALMNHPPTEFDPRELGEPLFPSKHSKEKMENEREIDPVKFESMNQGDPSPKEGLLYMNGLKTYSKKPVHFKKILNYTDVADEGKDFLCSINAGVGLDDYLYILDVYYTQEPQEVTEPGVASFLKRSQIREAYFEGNNGGRGFAREVDKLCKHRVVINTFHQGGNKESRVLSNAAEIGRKVLVPENWRSIWPQWSKDILHFRRMFKANTFDDCCFPAGTMISTIKGDRPIETLKVGDRVLTPFGVHKITDSRLTGYKEVIEQQGITATPDHKVFNGHKFVRLDTLTSILDNCTISKGELLIWKYKRLLHSMEHNTNLWGRDLITLVSQKTIRKERVLKDFMLQFGNIITTRKYLKGILFIIKMGILLITNPIIWNVYQGNNTLRSIPVKIKKRIDNILQRLELRLVYGIQLMKVGNGIGNMGKRLWKIEYQLKRTVLNVINRIKQFRTGQHSVVTYVENDTEENTQNTNMSMIENVSSVPKSLQQDIKRSQKQSVKHVVGCVETNSITKTEKRVAVYNITVDKDHVFYANSKLVSNCDALTGILEYSGVSDALMTALYKK